MSTYSEVFETVLVKLLHKKPHFPARLAIGAATPVSLYCGLLVLAGEPGDVNRGILLDGNLRAE